MPIATHLLGVYCWSGTVYSSSVKHSSWLALNSIRRRDTHLTLLTNGKLHAHFKIQGLRWTCRQTGRCSQLTYSFQAIPVGPHIMFYTDTLAFTSPNFSDHTRCVSNQCDIYKVAKIIHWNQSNNYCNWSDTINNAIYTTRALLKNTLFPSLSRTHKHTPLSLSLPLSLWDWVSVISKYIRTSKQGVTYCWTTVHSAQVCRTTNHTCSLCARNTRR